MSELTEVGNLDRFEDVRRSFRREKKRSWISNKNRLVADAKAEVDAAAEARADAEAKTEVEADVPTKMGLIDFHSVNRWRALPQAFLTQKLLRVQAPEAIPQKAFQTTRRICAADRRVVSSGSKQPGPQARGGQKCCVGNSVVKETGHPEDLFAESTDLRAVQINLCFRQKKKKFVS